MRSLNPLRILPIIALVAIASAWTGKAQAGCGDYITIRNSATAGMTGHGDRKPADSPQPCRGPHCSAHQRPVSPPMVPPATVMVTSSDLAIHSLSHDAADCRRSRLIPPASAHGPIHRPSLPFHPPRIAL